MGDRDGTTMGEGRGCVVTRESGRVEEKLSEGLNQAEVVYRGEVTAARALARNNGCGGAEGR